MAAVDREYEMEDEFEIEWGGFLTNHLSHGQWALDTLGAKDELNETFTRLYKTRLSPAGKESTKNHSIEDILELQGLRQDFLPQKRFFQKEISEHGVETTLSKYLPSLIAGLAGAAMHPVIHIAVGILSKRECVIAEGLAYLNHSYLAAVESDCDDIAEQPESIVYTYEHSREEAAADLVNKALAKTPPASLAMSGKFQRAMGGLLQDAEIVAALRNEADSQIPKDVSIEITSSDKEMIEAEYTSLDRLFLHALNLYVGTNSNDYFLLHGLHCVFAAQVIFDSFPSLPDKIRMDASNALKLALVATDWIQGCQSMTFSENQQWSKRWEKIMGKENFSTEKAYQWMKGRIDILLNEDSALPRNEHVYKCAAMCNIKLCRMIESQSKLTVPLKEVEYQQMVDLCAAVDLCMKCDFTGRGIGEKPTKTVNISKEQFRMNQLVLGEESTKFGAQNFEEEKKEDNCIKNTCGEVSIVSNICYTGPPKNSNNSPALFLDNPGMCPLRPGTVAAQHGSIPLEEKESKSLEGCNDLHPQNVRIWNARSCNANNKPTIETLGFQLVHTPRSSILSCEEGMRSVAENHPDSTRRYYSEIAPDILEATGATAAFAYCHAIRLPNPLEGAGRTKLGYAGYAHTDLSHNSWAARLPELVESGKWDTQGPPGLSYEAAKKAATSSRYAIVTAWRYLGPSDKCRASHLAVLDHRTVQKGDILPLALVANGCHGGNYRLSNDSDASQHEWYYYPDMTPEELLVFTAFDSNHPAKDTTFATSPVSTCMHSAFQDPNPPENEPPRQSIDVRFLLIWD